MPDTVPGDPRTTRSAVLHWVLRVLPILALLLVMGWAASMIVHLRDNPKCEGAPELPKSASASSPEPANAHCK